MAKKTVLFETHLDLGATITEYAGWDMPLHYGSQVEEHLIVRNSVGMFDVSHMAVIDILGASSEEFLGYILANDIRKINEPGKALYSCMLNENGGIIDDLIVYHINDYGYRLVVNAACTSKDLNWLKKNSVNYDIDIIHRTDLSIISVQGPKSLDAVINSLDPKYSEAVKNLKKFECVELNESDQCFVARTGYTGEDGFEIIVPDYLATSCWSKLRHHGVSPVGLGARDTLRLEAGFNLYGNEMNEDVTPLESNLSWTVPLGKNNGREFIGKGKLLAQKKEGCSTHLLGVKLQSKTVLRKNQKIYCDKVECGEITSGGYSPSLKCSIGIARLKKNISDNLMVDIRGKLYLLAVTKFGVKK